MPFLILVSKRQQHIGIAIIYNISVMFVSFRKNHVIGKKVET
jgi:hypothetical protein